MFCRNFKVGFILYFFITIVSHYTFSQETPQVSSQFSTECTSSIIGNYYLFFEMQLDKKTFEGLAQASWLSIDGYQSGKGRIAGPLDKSNVKLTTYQGEKVFKITIEDQLDNKVVAIIPTKIGSYPGQNMGLIEINADNSYEVTCNNGAKDSMGTLGSGSMGMGM